LNVKNKILNRLGLSKLYFDVNEFNSAITIFDTSIGTMNVGDEIINDSAKKWLGKIFPKSQFINLSTHDGISNVGLNRSSVGKFRFICGSNILNSNLLTSQQWNFSPIDFVKVEPLSLMGVGWSNYQKTPSLYTRWVYKNKLDKSVIHSVRDSYTESMLKSIGFKNVINTACPTMWALTEELCDRVPKEKGENVIFTLTDYRPDIEADSAMIKILKSSYKKVYFWVQGSKDLSYFSKLDESLTNEIEVVSPRLDLYDSILKSTLSLDFVGTRLHAGIRALQNERRTIIIGVDNRAIEKKKDFNIPVVLRKNINTDLKEIINSDFSTKISIPTQNINAWMEQF
jgi:hypothetical protein